MYTWDVYMKVEFARGDLAAMNHGPKVCNAAACNSSFPTLSSSSTSLSRRRFAKVDTWTGRAC
jgi:hypothetical protein